MSCRLMRLLMISLLLCLASPLSGEAAETVSSRELSLLENIFREAVLKDSPWPREDVRITNFSVRPPTMTLPGGGFDYRITQKPNDFRPGKKLVTTAILKEGRDQGEVKMSGDLRLFGPVVSTTKKLNRNGIITGDDLSVKREDISMLDSGLVKDPREAIGKKLKVSLPAGAILYTQAIDDPPLVKRGERVTIMARSQNIQVTTPGEAKNSGALGEVVRVKNLASRREIQARVLGAGIVEAEF